MLVKCIASSSSGNCYMLDDGQTRLLLDAGLPFKQVQKELNFETSTIAAALISHEHNDHSKAVKDLFKAGIDVYASQGTLDALKVRDYRARPVKAKERFTVGTWAVMPFDTQHDAKEPFGYLLASSTGEKVLYATDTYYIRYYFKGLTVIMVECNHSYEILRENVKAGIIPVEMKNRLIKSHFSLENVKEFLKANDLSRVREIHLLHLSDGNSDAERFKREIQRLTGKMVFVAEK